MPEDGNSNEAQQQEDQQQQADQQAQDGTSEEKDWQAEAEKWRNLARKHEKQAKDNKSAADQLAELEKQNMSADERFAEAQIRAVEAEMQLMRYQAAADKGLPSSAAMFLYGDDEDEIGQSADALIKFATEYAQTVSNRPQPRPADFMQGNRGSTPQQNPNDLFRSAIRSRNVFG